MLQSAAKADVEVSPDPSLVPWHGWTFEWLDGFLQKHPNVVELSDRKIQDWAARSGMARPPKAANSWDQLPAAASSCQLPAAQEKKKVFRAKAINDLAPTTLSKFLQQFTLPVPWLDPVGRLQHWTTAL
eukprot:Skav211933  [mRNA]  locus=scaffold1086:399251:408381:+ [translate_table: standard]